MKTPNDHSPETQSDGASLDDAANADKTGDASGLLVWTRRLWQMVCSGVAALSPTARIEPADPGKELRFTRGAQAVHFVVGAVVCACAAFALLTLGFWPWNPDGSPFWAYWWLGLVPVLPFGLCLWLAIYCTSHAYVILSPVGVEVFSLFYPSENFRLVPWTSIRGVRVAGSRMILEFGAVGHGGVVLSLRPLRPEQRELLLHATLMRCSHLDIG